MAVNQAKISGSPELMAEQVLKDIRNRGLVSGDRYLTAEEARSTFQVGKGLMNDTLKLLADRQILVRKRKAGTFIGPQFSVEMNTGAAIASKRLALDIVHVLMPMDYYRANVIPGALFVEEIARVIPGVSVQLHHIADANTTQYTLGLVSRLKTKREQREGLVLLRSSRETQLAVQDSGVPAIVFGSTYPDVKQLASLDTDQGQAGRLAAQAALEHSHERFALIMRNHWRRGDNLLIEGLAKAFGEAGVGIDQVSIVSSPEQADVIKHDVAALLSQEPYPTALICRSRFHTDAAVRGIKERGLEPGKDVMVIGIRLGATADLDAAGVSIVPVIDSAEQVRKIGLSLLQIAEGNPPAKLCERIAMKVEVAR